jgi:hypothetical protein
LREQLPERPAKKPSPMLFAKKSPRIKGGSMPSPSEGMPGGRKSDFRDQYLGIVDRVEPECIDAN